MVSNYRNRAENVLDMGHGVPGPQASIPGVGRDDSCPVRR